MKVGTEVMVDGRPTLRLSDPDRIALRNQFRTMVQAAIID